MVERILFDYDLSEIYNINEELIIEIMEKLLNEDTVKCRCRLCVEDMYAISLNLMQPLYIQSSLKQSSFKGYDVYKLINRGKMEAAVREAINRVNKHPHH